MILQSPEVPVDLINVVRSLRILCHPYSWPWNSLNNLSFTKSRLSCINTSPIKSITSTCSCYVTNNIAINRPVNICQIGWSATILTYVPWNCSVGYVSPSEAIVDKTHCVERIWTCSKLLIWFALLSQCTIVHGCCIWYITR